MRIISQSGSLDMPYELVELEILEVKNELKTMYSKGYMVVAFLNVRISTLQLVLLFCNS